MKMDDSLDQLLDARLRDEAAYVDDDGFTARVLQQLPARPRSFQLQRSLIILSAAIFSVIAAYFASGEAMFLRTLLGRLTTLPPVQLFTLLFASAMFLFIGSALAAFAAHGRDQSS